MKTTKILLILLLGVLLQFSFAQKKAFSIEALYKVINPGAPVYSPSGTKALFTVSSSNLGRGTTNTDIYIYENGSTRALLNSTKAEYNPIWIDDNSFYFIMDGQIQKYSLTDGSTTQITSTYLPISNPVLSPDKKLIAFETSIYPSCGFSEACNRHTDSTHYKGPLQAVVADDLLFRHWTSYNDEKETHLAVYNLETKEYIDAAKSELIASNYMLGGGIKYNFSPDSKKIAYVNSDEKNMAASTNFDIFIKDLSTGKVENITSKNKAWDGSPVFSNDGKTLAFRTHKTPNYEADRFQIALYDLATSKITYVTKDFDYTIGDFMWSGDDKSIYFEADYKAYTPVFKLNLSNNKIDTLIKKSISGFDINSKGEIIYTARSVDVPSEVYLWDGSNTTKITSLNEALTQEYDFRPAEQMWVKGADGVPVHLFVIKPHNFDPNKKYPLILNVHGGPQSQWQDAFRGDWQVYGGYGYVVAFCNPHGSTGYGSKYTEAISKDWGGKVYEDIMKVTDKLETLPYVDKNRMGAMGWSYGGYMMNWLQAKTNRFKCLASMMGIYDITSMWGATEELWFVNWDLNGQPWNSNLYKKFSPSEYTKNFKTPTLILTGERDYRVPYTQSVEYFTTLRTLGIDSRLIIFKNDGHWPNNVKSMPLYYNSHLEWFHKYLGGDAAPYDSKKMVINQAFEPK